MSDSEEPSAAASSGDDSSARSAFHRARAGAAGDGGTAPRRYRQSRGGRPGASVSSPGPGAPLARDPELVGEIAHRLLAQNGFSEELRVGSVVGRWAEIVGRDLAAHCEVESFTAGRLVVRADSTAWATQLRLLKPQLQRRLAEEVGEGAVLEIDVLAPAAPSWNRGKRTVRGGRGPRDTYG